MAVYLHKNDLPSSVKFSSVAIDTETMGLHLQRDRLCLVQLSGGDGDCHLVQLEKTPQPAPHLCALLEDPTVLKIFHYARFDVAALYKYLGVITAPLYCTKIASKLIRTYTDRHGLKDLCRELLSVELSKQEQTSNWGAEVLTDSQLNYAANDVLYLHQLKEKLDLSLERENRAALAQACFDFIPGRVKLDLLVNTEYDIFHH